MTSCCWNLSQGFSYHNEECLVTFGPQFRLATLTVVFMDGKTLVYDPVLVCINRLENDGISIDGTTLRFETADEGITALGVRQFSYEIHIDDY